MKINIRQFFIILTVFISTVLLFPKEVEATNLSFKDKFELKVLFVGGNSGRNVYKDKFSTETLKLEINKRMSHFKEFLDKHFSEVLVIKSSEYKESMSKDYDVTIFDCALQNRRLIYVSKDVDGEEIRTYMNTGRLSEDYSYPSLCIGRASNDVGRSIGTKLDWYCLCLHDNAFGMNLNHDIFNKPIKVDLTLKEEATPSYAMNFQKYSAKKIPSTQMMWRVIKKDLDFEYLPGMVCRPWGFDDSPDVEIISGGESMKCVEAIAIARHGNFFHWGFMASPNDMTNEAQKVFINAIIYTSKLKGEKVIARKFDDRAQYRSKSKAFIKTWDDETKELFKNYEPYLYASRKEEDKGNLVVDEDAKYFGIPNNNIKILDKAILCLEKGIDIDKAQRVLDRYTLVTFKNAKAYRDWYNKNKKAFFFTETGGSYFLINPKLVSYDKKSIYGNDYTLCQIERAARDLVCPLTSRYKPVSYTQKVIKTLTGSLAIIVKLNIQKTYHIYPMDLNSDTFIPTKLDIQLPKGFVKDGSLQIQYNDEGDDEIKGEVVFFQRVYGGNIGVFKCKLSYQCCNFESCTPPQEIDFEAKMK